jgi:predicted nuclease with TOPRIM domain
MSAVEPPDTELLDRFLAGLHGMEDRAVEQWELLSSIRCLAEIVKHQHLTHIKMICQVSEELSARQNRQTDLIKKLADTQERALELCNRLTGEVQKLEKRLIELETNAKK